MGRSPRRTRPHRLDLLPIDEGAEIPAVGKLNDAEMLIALDGRRSSETADGWRARHPDRPVIVGLVGTDLHVDMPSDASTMANVAAADALIVLHPAAAERLHALEPSWADKTHVIHQSVDPPLPPRQIPFDGSRVVVLAPLRSIDDPLLAARAASMLPPTSRVAVHHGGRALDDDGLLQASAEAASNKRYVWHGELNRPAALELLASAHVIVCTSISDGGATSSPKPSHRGSRS